MKPEIIILDCGSQYTQLIARRIREAGVFCEIRHWQDKLYDTAKGIIISGSPFSIYDRNAPAPDITGAIGKKPVLGICYGAQYLARLLGGKVLKTSIREYGPARIKIINRNGIFEGLPEKFNVWMSHSDSIVELPVNSLVNAITENEIVASFSLKEKAVYAVQFHPEVYHTEYGIQILKNFIYKVCQCEGNWTPKSFVEMAVSQIKEEVGEDGMVIGALSGGIDSTTATMLVIKSAVPCKFFLIDTGLLRKNEVNEIISEYKKMGITVEVVNAQDQFLNALQKITEPEMKRKIIGATFIDCFSKAVMQHNLFNHPKLYLLQGTIYPDVIESGKGLGPSATIKSHHNVGGLPPQLPFKLLEPLKYLFKDEVREVAKTIGISDYFIKRHPFPGPGIAIRIIGEITKEKINILREVDAIFIDELKKEGIYDKIWQAFAVLLPVKSVGVMGDERTYEYAVVLRAVTSTDGMTASPYPFNFDFLQKIATKIVNTVKGVNRVTYDISSKPPATIEWE